MYLIPRNVTAKFQFFPGFGWTELLITLAGAAVGGVLAFAAGLVTRSLVVRVILFIVPAAAAYFSTRPGPDGTSILALLRRWRAYQHRQKIYLYVTGRGQD